MRIKCIKRQDHGPHVITTFPKLDTIPLKFTVLKWMEIILDNTQFNCLSDCWLYFEPFGKLNVFVCLRNRDAHNVYKRLYSVICMKNWFSKLCYKLIDWSRLKLLEIMLKRPEEVVSDSMIRVWHVGAYGFNFTPLVLCTIVGCTL